MLANRIVGAFTFRSGVYAEVEKDTGFTTTAWILVIVVAFLNQLGSFASADVVGWAIGAVLGTIGTVIGFAVAAFVFQLVGRSLFNAEVTFEEMVRTLGLAYVWNVVGVLGVLGVIPALACLLAPVMIIAWILMVVAWLVAAKEALDLEWVPTIVTVIIGGIVYVVLAVATAMVAAFLGAGTSAITSAIGGALP